jgi:hypothetical protein
LHILAKYGNFQFDASFLWRFSHNGVMGQKGIRRRSWKHRREDPDLLVFFIFWVMLNSILGHLISILKIEIKDKINVDKTTFYILDALNAQIPRQNFHIYMLN